MNDIEGAWPTCSFERGDSPEAKITIHNNAPLFSYISASTDPVFVNDQFSILSASSKSITLSNIASIATISTGIRLRLLPGLMASLTPIKGSGLVILNTLIDPSHDDEELIVVVMNTSWLSKTILFGDPIATMTLIPAIRDSRYHVNILP